MATWCEELTHWKRPWCLERLMVKLKLQYFGPLMRRADSFEATLILGKIQGGRRRRRQSQLNRHESGQTPGIDDGQGGLEWSSPWVTKSQIGLSSWTETELNWNYGGCNEDNGDLLQKVHACTVTISAPNPASNHSWPTSLLGILGQSGTNLGHSLLGSLLLSPGSWCVQVLFVPSKSLFPSPV